MKNSKQSLLSYELKLHKETLQNEIKHRNDFSDRAYKSITVIISIVGALIWLIIKFSSLYKTECCYILTINILLLVLLSIMTIMIICGFFKTLYNYNDTRINPEILCQKLNEYKSNNPLDENVIELMDKSLVLTYADSATKTYKENEEHTKMLRQVYLWIIVDVILLAITFLIEIFV